MNIGFLYLFLIIFCWSINPFLKKSITKKLSSLEYNFANSICILIILFIIITYNNYITKNSNKINMNFISNLNFKELIILVISAGVTLLASYSFIKAIQNMDVSFVLPFTQSLTIVISTLIGVLVMNETYNYNIGFGVLLISSGVYLLTNK